MDPQGTRQLFSPSESARSRRGVLVVDDDPREAEALATLLRQRGYEIRTARSVAGALRHLASFRPAAIVIEPVLAGRDGFGGCDLARAVRRFAWGAQVNLLALTGYGHPACQARCRLAGFDCYMQKPMMIDELPPSVFGGRSPRRNTLH